MEQHTKKSTKPKLSFFGLIKKYFWFIVIFFVISITSGILLAEMEANSTSNWKTYTSKAGSISFKHPSSYEIVEDQGWRITVYTSKSNPENNIKIIYSHKDSNTFDQSAEEQFLANCQAAKVNEINANGSRIKVYEDSTCGAQLIENSILVYSNNTMTYDIGVFGSPNRNQLYKFLSTVSFSK